MKHTIFPPPWSGLTLPKYEAHSRRWMMHCASLFSLIIRRLIHIRQAKDLQELSSLGHFLKGSSGQIGVARVEVSCQKIQYYGKLRNEHDDGDVSDTQALDRITALLAQVKNDYEAAEDWLKNWYMERGVEGPPADD